MATKINIGDAWKDMVVAVIEEANGENMRMKVIDIGDWNMDTVASVNVAHGLTLANIRTIQFIIRNDANDTYYPLEYYGDAACSGYWKVDATNVILSKYAGEFFDGEAFDATSFNRGWVTIWYVV